MDLTIIVTIYLISKYYIQLSTSVQTLFKTWLIQFSKKKNVLNDIKKLFKKLLVSRKLMFRNTQITLYCYVNFTIFVDHNSVIAQSLAETNACFDLSNMSLNKIV